jgi:hypothetical protein
MSLSPDLFTDLTEKKINCYVAGTPNRECHKALLAASSASCFFFLLYLPLNPKDGGNAFVQNVSGLLPEYVALCPKGQFS